MTPRRRLRKLGWVGDPRDMSDTVLSPRDLNRILLDRQMLLERQALDPVAALERLFAMQAQLPRAPFLGLWARLQDFRRQDLLDAIHARRVVRSTLMRGTLHLASAANVIDAADWTCVAFDNRGHRVTAGADCATAAGTPRIAIGFNDQEPLYVDLL